MTKKVEKKENIVQNQESYGQLKGEVNEQGKKFSNQYI